MSHLNALITDLRDRKLWPVPLALVAILVALPVLLTSHPSAHSGPSAGLAVAGTQAGNTVTLDATPVQAPLAAGGRDPFTQQKLPGATTVSVKTTGSSTGGASTASAATGASSSTQSSSTGSSTGSSSGATGSSSGNGTYTGGGSTGTGTGTGTGTTTPTTPSHPKTPPSGLTPADAYHVSVSITDASGGVTPIDPLERDGALPSDQKPLLVQLGVAQGAHRVLFAVLPGTVVSGPGVCIPGPLDCEILSLAPGQTEALATQTASGATQVAMFQITAISLDHYGSKAFASAARAQTDAVGRKLLAHSTAATLNLFQYDPSLDAVVDERNLTVGGN